MSLPSAKTLLREITDGGVSTTLAWLSSLGDPELSWQRPPLDREGRVIVPSEWPVNPRGRLA